MKGKKIATWLLSVLCLGALTFGVACNGCDCSGSDNSSSSAEQSSVIESSSEIGESSETAESSDEAESSEEAVSSDEAESSEEAVSSDEAESSEEAVSSDEAESSEEAVSSDEAESSEEAVSSDEAESSEEAVSSDEAESSEEAVSSDEAESSEELISSEPPESGEPVESEPEASSSDEEDSSEDEDSSSEEHAHYWVMDKIIDPTCTQKGYTVYGCAGCDEGRYIGDWVDALGHAYEVTEFVDATCTQDGHILFTCDRCGGTKTQIIKATGHEFGDDNVCDKCGYTVSPHDHSYTQTVVNPTCKDMGYTKYTCDCGHEYKTNYIEALGHKFDDGVETQEKTCTQDGEMKYTCERCGEYYTEVIPAGHNWSETVTKPATCTQDGEKSKVCLACGAKEKEVIPAGHTWEEKRVIKEPKCKEEGETEYECSVCHETKTEKVKELGHHFVNGVCQRCGAEFMDDVTEDINHPEYGMYFVVDEIVSAYGPIPVDEYGVYLHYNAGAQIERVAVYLTQDGTMWRRCIACTGTNIEYATYVPYLSNDGEMKYTGLNSDMINIFPLSKNSDGIWCYSDYATIGVNLEDNKGNLLLSLYDIGQAGAKTKLFDSLPEMIAWLKNECVHNYTVIDEQTATCTQDGYKTYYCDRCENTYDGDYVKAEGHNYAVADQEKSGDVYIVSLACACGATTEATASFAYVVQPSCKARGYTVYEYSYDNGIGETLQGEIRVEPTEITDVHTVTDGTVTFMFVQDGQYNYNDTIKALLSSNVIRLIGGLPNCMSYSTAIAECSVCANYFTFQISGKHEYMTTTHQPTCQKQGYTEYYCWNCGDSFQGNYVDPVDCKYENLQYDDIQHWYECKWCGDVDNTTKENHYGGTATTTEKAKCEICGQEYGELATPPVDPTDPVLPGPETYERLSDGTINFGAYPQSKVTDSTLTTALTSAAGALPTASNSQSWTSYKYYIGTDIANSGVNTTDYMWYQDVVYNGNSYRGVYFTSYRPYYTCKSSSTGYTYQDDNGYTTGTVYWFAYEVLNWTVLEEKNGEVFLLCNSIIDSQEYYDNYNNRTINGATVYANNYAESNIRKWLNETFYETAFTSLQQNLIKVTEVDNSAKSTNPYGQPNYWNSGVNNYACANTNDKIFLLSEEEVTNSNYGFSSDPHDYGTTSTRIRKPSDYAQSQGCYRYNSSGSSYHGNGVWWLRSPGYRSDYFARPVGDAGSADDYYSVDHTRHGVVPALKLAVG